VSSDTLNTLSTPSGEPEPLYTLPAYSLHRARAQRGALTGIQDTKDNRALFVGTPHGGWIEKNTKEGGALPSAPCQEVAQMFVLVPPLTVGRRGGVLTLARRVGQW